MSQEIITYKCSQSYSSAAYYTPYNPVATYQVSKTIEDVDGTWYTMRIDKNEIVSWVYEQPIEKWRYIDGIYFDLHSDVYNWFILRWS